MTQWILNHFARLFQVQNLIIEKEDVAISPLKKTQFYETTASIESTDLQKKYELLNRGLFYLCFSMVFISFLLRIFKELQITNFIDSMVAGFKVKHWKPRILPNPWVLLSSWFRSKRSRWNDVVFIIHLRSQNHYHLTFACYHSLTSSTLRLF